MLIALFHSLNQILILFQRLVYRSQSRRFTSYYISRCYYYHYC